MSNLFLFFRMYVLRLFYFFILFFVFINKVQAQSKKIVDLEFQVYNLNNQFKYTKSQGLIESFIEKEANSNEDLAYAYVIWSYTYKRLYDYTTTISKLETAKVYARKSNNKEKLVDIVNAQLAFSLFDTKNYKESLQLIEKLYNKGFKYNSVENKAKLLMQLAYIGYLNKEYSKSELRYHQAIILMKKSAPCHLPMIYTKLMSLYDKTNQISKQKEAMQKSLYYADSCKILKYSIYIYGEYDKILKQNNEIKESFRVNKILDSINAIYKLENNLGKLHLEKQKQLVKDKEKVEEKVSLLNMLSSIFAFLIFLVLILLLISQKIRVKLKKSLGFYEEKYNDLWVNYQISTKQLKKLKEELSKQSKGGNKELDSLLKDLSIHLKTDIKNEHEYINVLKDNFIKLLNKEAPYLNAQEQLICFFMSLQMSQKKIGELLNKTEKSIGSYKYRINNKIKEKHNMSIDGFIATLKLKKRKYKVLNQ